MKTALIAFVVLFLGCSGPAGEPGVPGTNGTDGISGEAGAAGPVGAAGHDGTNGAPGSCQDAGSPETGLPIYVSTYGRTETIVWAGGQHSPTVIQDCPVGAQALSGGCVADYPVTFNAPNGGGTQEGLIGWACSATPPGPGQAVTITTYVNCLFNSGWVQ